MKWIKEALIDVAVTLLILVAVFTDASWARWIVTAYTVLLLGLKVISLAASGLLGQLRKRDEGPDWLYHLLYGLNVLALLAATWWLLAAGWTLIWLLSFIYQRKSRTLIVGKGPRRRKGAKRKGARPAGQPNGDVGAPTER